jgi:hypothetical protein
MDLSTATNPETETVEVEATEVETPDEQPLEGEAEAPEGEEEAPEEEEELDIDGNPLKVPKTLAEKLKARMMMQADYTQKTQQIAEQRREYEAQRQAFEAEQETRQALFNEEAQLHTVRQRLSDFQNVNWQQLAAQNPQQALAAQAEYTQLRDYHDRLNGHVEGRKAELAAVREQETAIAMQQAMEALSKPNPDLGWDGRFDAEKSKALTDFGMKLGFTNEELANTTHPLMIQTLNLARLGMKHLEAQRKAPQRPAAEPAAKVPAAKSQAFPRNPEQMSMAQYAAARKAGRIK